MRKDMKEEWEIHYEAGKEDERRRILKMIDEWYDNRKSIIFDVDELKKQIKGGN